MNKKAAIKNDRKNHPPPSPLTLYCSLHLAVEEAVGQADDEALGRCDHQLVTIIIDHRLITITIVTTWVDVITASTASKTSTTSGTPMLPTVGFTTRVRMWPTPSKGITKIRAWQQFHFEEEEEINN